MWREQCLWKLLTPTILLHFSLWASHTRFLMFHNYGKHFHLKVFHLAIFSSTIALLSIYLACLHLLGSLLHCPFWELFWLWSKRASPLSFHSRILLFIFPSQYHSLFDIKLNIDLYLYCHCTIIYPTEGRVCTSLFTHVVPVHSKVPILKTYSWKLCSMK